MRETRRRKRQKLVAGVGRCGSFNGESAGFGSISRPRENSLGAIVYSDCNDVKVESSIKSTTEGEARDIRVHFPTEGASSMACSHDSLFSTGKKWGCGAGSSRDEEGWSSGDNLVDAAVRVPAAAVLTRGDFFGVAAPPVPLPDDEV